MKKTIIVIACLLFLQSAEAQVIRENRKEPKTGVKPKTLPVTDYPEAFLLVDPKVVLYEQANFSGQSKSFGVGTYRFYGAVDFNDLGSSIKVPNGLIAFVYEHANEAGGYGNYIDLMEDCTDLSTYNFNDKTSFLTVISAARKGFLYARNRMINNQIVAGHWQRERAGGTNPDNSLPAVISYLQPTLPEPTASLKNAPAFEDIAVYRLQLRITTGTGTDAGTDDPVYTQMNNNDKRFYLVKGIDNFIQGRTLTYDVLTANIRKIKDIQFLRFGIKGDDGVCFKRVELILNNFHSPIFTKAWIDGKGNCIDNGSSSLLPLIEISGLELRTSPGWKYIVTNPSNVSLCWPPTTIAREWITSLVEASVGNQLQYMNGDLQWGTGGTISTLWGDAVESKMINDHTLKFDLDLQEDVLGPNPEVDVNFEFDFHCINGVLSADVENFNINRSTYGDFHDFLSGFAGALTTGPGYAILIDILNRGYAYLQPDGAVVTSNCTNIVVTPNGDIRLR